VKCRRIRSQKENAFRMTFNLDGIGEIGYIKSISKGVHTMSKQFINKRTIVTILEVVDAGEPDRCSKYIKEKLAERGWLEAVRVGRRKEWDLSSRARGYLAVARNWGKKTANLKQFRDEIAA
jgi:hypothetical protein